MTPEEIVAAIWDRWDRDLKDWDLGGSTANAEALRLAVETVSERLAQHREAAQARSGPFEHKGMGVCNKGRIHDGPCDYGNGV